jgi:drug/metabolite transporter (DMT)-like permease
MLTVNARMSRQEWGLLLLLSLLWSGSFPFAKIAVGELPPLTVVLARVGLAAALLLAALFMMGIRLPRSPAAWGELAVMGLLNNLLPFGLLFWGQTHIGAGHASILNAMTPMFSVLLAPFFLAEERLTLARLVGILIGIVGVGLLVGPAALEGFGGDLLAQLACLGATLSYAFAGIYGRRFKAYPPMVTASGQLLASTLLLLPAVLMVDRPWLLPWPSVETWAALLGLASLSTALAYIVYFRILATTGATNLLLVTLLLPPGAIALAVLLLGEAVVPRHLAGLAIIALGLAVLDGRLFACFMLRLATR